jgi:hypothetical protein
VAVQPAIGSTSKNAPITTNIFILILLCGVARRKTLPHRRPLYGITIVPTMQRWALSQTAHRPNMIGTTRSRVNFFMNKFRKLGFIQYNGEIHVNNSLLSVVLHD